MELNLTGWDEVEALFFVLCVINVGGLKRMASKYALPLRYYRRIETNSLSQADQGYSKEVQDAGGGGEGEGGPGGAGQPGGGQREGKSQTQGSLHPVGRAGALLGIIISHGIIVDSRVSDPHLIFCGSGYGSSCFSHCEFRSGSSCF